MVASIAPNEATGLNGTAQLRVIKPNLVRMLRTAKLVIPRSAALLRSPRSFLHRCAAELAALCQITIINLVVDSEHPKKGKGFFLQERIVSKS